MIYTIRIHKSNGTVKVLHSTQYLEVLAKARAEGDGCYEIEQWYSERNFKSGYNTSVLPTQNAAIREVQNNG